MPGPVLTLPGKLHKAWILSWEYPRLSLLQCLNPTQHFALAMKLLQKQGIHILTLAFQMQVDVLESFFSGCSSALAFEYLISSYGL